MRGLNVLRRDTGAPFTFQSLFPWMTWLCLLGANVWFIHQFGTNSPFQNDWRLIPAVFDQVPPDYSSLPRLILTALYRASGPDFRAGMFANLALLAGLAAAMIMVSRSERGRADWSDAIYPLLLLHWAHASTLLVSGQLNIALVTAFAGLILVLVARDGQTPFPLWRIGGAPSSSPSPRTPLPEGKGRRRWPGIVLAPAALLVWSAVELRSQTSLVTEPSRWLPSVMEFLAMGIGSVGRQWPMALGGMIALVFIGGVYMLFKRWWKQPGERRRLFGFLAWAGGFSVLALCDLPQGQWRRPVTLAALGPCWIMLVLMIYGRSAFARFIPRLATLGLLALLWPWPIVIDRGYFNVRVQTNTGDGLEQGEVLRKQFEAMRSDIDAGLPEMVIAYRYSRLPDRIGPRLPEYLFARGLSLLRDQRIGMFAGLRPDPDCERVPVGRLARQSRDFHFDFAGGRHIYGAWIKVEPVTSSQPVMFEMSWNARHGSPSSGSYRTTVAGHAEDVLVWIDQTIVEADIQCDRQVIRSLRVDVLMPHDPAIGSIQ
jgi:hypothetical protein